MYYLFQGLLLGLAYVAPIGTQNMFVINTALTQKRKRVLLTALIVCFFDITLAVACFYGVGALISTHPLIQLIVVGIGGLVVIWLGIGLIRSRSSLDTGVDTNIPIGKIITTACVVTWFNPHAIIDGSMLFGTYRATLPGNAGTMFIIGVSCASALWWFRQTTAIPSCQFTLI